MWTTIGDIFIHNTGKALNAANNDGVLMDYITTSNLYWDKFDLTVVKQMLFTDTEIEKCTVKYGDLLVCEGGDIGRAAIWTYDYDVRIQNHIHRLRGFCNISHRFYYYIFLLYKMLNLIGGKGVAIQGLSSNDLHKLVIPLPPIKEQCRIVSIIESWFSVIDRVEQEKKDLCNAIKQIKSKILDLAIHGKLVSQDPNDEPAIELLRRINPSFKSCDNAHYKNLPSGWSICRLEDIVDYEQPQAYIVDSTDYSEDYPTPVLTAGKSFIIGYTNETDGICDNLPVIIFDDFTTDSRFVDFPFKIKSSAMKILRVKKEIDIRYVGFYMSITRLVGDTHKRYWISEYSKLPILIPPKAEQERIVQTVTDLLGKLDNIIAEL
ncbi:MAG: restriction endonuclease subunit S [Alistipes communis]|nr:restriction endonuclease subunit S [Alistipes communis]